MINIKSIIEDSISTKSQMMNLCIDDINNSAELMLRAVKNGKKILWCGNGGSAADSQHMAAELMGGLRVHERMPIPSIALSTDTSFITAWANDADFSLIFSRQIEGIGNAGDILIAITTSGNSVNICRAVETAIIKKLNVIILTGESSGKLVGKGDIQINIPSKDTQRIQEGHLLVEHILCEIVESDFISNIK